MLRIPMQILVYCYRIKDGRKEFLLLKRTARRGGFWQGITGAPELNEDLLQAAKRELQEETGIIPIQINQVNYSFCYPVDPKWKKLYHPDIRMIHEYVFKAECEGTDPHLSSEHELFVWCDFQEALQRLTFIENKKALEACIQVGEGETSYLVKNP